MKHVTFGFLVAVLLAGCGIEQDYVLREPITVRFAKGSDPVTIPAGTHVKQTFFKENISFVAVYGETSRGQLLDAAESE